MKLNVLQTIFPLICVFEKNLKYYASLKAQSLLLLVVQNSSVFELGTGFFVVTRYNPMVS